MLDQLLTVEDVSAKLRMHPETVRHMCRKGELPSYKVGKRIRINSRLLDDWLSRRRIDRTR